MLEKNAVIDRVLFLFVFFIYFINVCISLIYIVINW